jgi:hypothetical protein
MTVPNGYSPLATAMRDSSMQRAIMAWSVLSRSESMAAVLHLLHAINPGAIGGSISGALGMTDWPYHPSLQFTA